MKQLLSALLVVLAISLQSGCRSAHGHRTPPGQAKKVTGTQSAKPYAPGQVKKATGAKSAKSYAPGQGKQKGKQGKGKKP